MAENSPFSMLRLEGKEGVEFSNFERALDEARRQGWSLLPEPAGFSLLATLGFEIPGSIVFERPEDLTPDMLADLPGERVVLKIVSPDLAHKTESGGVALVPRTEGEIRAAAERMRESSQGIDIKGFMLQEFIDYDRSLGGELLLSLRWDREFGTVLTCGPGGLHAELLARDLRPQKSLAFASPELLDTSSLAARLASLTTVSLLTTSRRGRSAQLTLSALLQVVTRFAGVAGPLMEREVDELEVNPLVVHQGSLIALDVLVRLSGNRPPVSPPRPAEKIERLLKPQSIAVVGASRRLNPGRMILKNILREGFDPRRVYVVKPDLDELEGCRCVPEVAELPEPVDLLIVSVSAEQFDTILTTVIETEGAESLIVIPGGLEEKPGSTPLVTRLRTELVRSRQSPWGGPIVNGGNCMGIRSAPGRYDTFFLPEHKLPPPGKVDSSSALVAQSGAFLAAKSSKLAEVAFKYSISVGNQLDVTIGDYLSYLAQDSELALVAVYVEGFRALDGRVFLEAAQRMHSEGRTVVLYRAGRSEAGAGAAASHTASMAGSYEITAELARAAGVLVAESLQDFEDLVVLAVKLRNRRLSSMRLAGLSNAGFECVALWDHLGVFEAASYSSTTMARLEDLFVQAGVSGLVEVRNPLDLTPMMGDRLFADVVKAVLDDDNVDVGAIGCVPLTGELSTLPPGSIHKEDLARPDAIASRLIELWRHTSKPLVMVIDAGRQYDPLAEHLRQAGLPTFRTADRAMQMLETYCLHRLSMPAAGPDRPVVDGEPTTA